ncbi:LPXTG cell wall anchor domain-containing protein, partial [Arthrobacter sp.]
GAGNNSGATTGGELSHTGANGVLPILGIAFLALLGGAATILVRRRRNHG